MRCALKIWLALFAAALLPGAVLAASFTASLDRDTIALGESATLSLSFEGAQPSNVPTPRVPGLQFTQAGTSQNVSIINGAMTSTVTVSFSVTPERTGEFTIPALTADVNGQALTSQPVKLTVTKTGATAGANANSQFAFARLSLPKQKVYCGETVVADLQLFYRRGVQLGRQPQLTSEPADGFLVGKVVGDNQSLAQVGNAIYNVIPAKIALTATKTGTLHVGPVTISLDLLIPTNDRQSDFFDPFGMMRRNVEKQISVATETVDVESLPLPAQGQPVDFTGAVGNFTMTGTVGPTNVTVGDPITVRVQISGRGALDALTVPAQKAWQDFKTYPPTTKLATTDPFGFEGTKTFEQIISPGTAAVREVPPVSFSFFNPDDGRYHTLTAPATPLIVHAAAATPLPTLAGIKNAAAENPPAPELLPLKENLGTLKPAGAPLVAQPVFLAAQSVPVLAFLAAFIWRKRADNLANNPRRRRQRVVAALVASGLDDLKKYAAANQPDEFFATLFRLLQEQLGERLDCPASAITENVVEENSLLRNAPAALRDALREQFQLCNQARYAPVRGTAELNSVAGQFEQLIGELQNLKA